MCVCVFTCPLQLMLPVSPRLVLGQTYHPGYVGSAVQSHVASASSRPDRATDGNSAPCGTQPRARCRSSAPPCLQPENKRTFQLVVLVIYGAACRVLQLHYRYKCYLTSQTRSASNNHKYLDRKDMTDGVSGAN